MKCTTHVCFFKPTLSNVLAYIHEITKSELVLEEYDLSDLKFKIKAT